MKTLALLLTLVLSTFAISSSENQEICKSKTLDKFSSETVPGAQEFYRKCIERLESIDGSEFSDSLKKSSLQNREGLRSNFDLGIGVRSSGATEAFLAYSYFINPSKLIRVNLISLTGESEEKLENDSGEQVSIGISTKFTGSALNVLYKQFLGNSFYLAGGADYSSLEASYGFSSTSIFSGQDVSLGTIKKLSIDLRLGNQWQWENFTLGTDWVGFLIPLVTDSDLADNFPSRLDGPKNFKNSETSEATYLRFYLGWSF